MRKVAIIQARMGSTRYPRKVLHKVQGKSILAHIIYRLKKVKALDGIVVATTMLERDDAVVEEVGREANVGIFRGDEEDVLGRFLKAAEKTGADYIVRVCGDAPFIDPQESTKTISMVSGSLADYGSNKHDKGVVLGAGIEMVSMKCLSRLDKIAEGHLYREHVTNYVVDGPGENMFSRIFVDADTDKNCPNLDLTIDTEKDIRDLDTLASSVEEIKDCDLGLIIKHCKKERLFNKG